MTNNPAPAPRRMTPEKKVKMKNALVRGCVKIWQVLTHQWGWKLTSLLLAIFLWGGLVSQNQDLPREKVFDNVRVSITNHGILQENGLIVVGGLEKVSTVRIKVQVPQRNYAAATAANYNVRLDLSQIKEPGSQKVQIVAAPVSTSLYGKVTELSMPEVVLQVEEYAVRSRIPVLLREEGMGPEGFYLPSPALDPGAVTIAGPKALVSQVARCIVPYNRAALPAVSGEIPTSLPLLLEDYQGNPVDMTHITVSSQSEKIQNITVRQTQYPLASVPISVQGLISGQPASGFQVTDISLSPASVQIAADDLSPFLAEDYMLQPYSRLSIEGASQTVASTLSLRKPANAEYISDYEVRLVVTIEKIPDESPEEGKLNP